MEKSLNLGLPNHKEAFSMSGSHRLVSIGRVTAHRPTRRRLTAVVTSAFLLLQAASGLLLPQVAYAAPASVMWTERADFEHNASSLDVATTRYQVDTVTSPGDVKLSGPAVDAGVGSFHALGLRADGTVMGNGWDGYEYAWEGSEFWTDIVAVTGGEDHTVGLRSDGTVVTAGSGASGLNTDDWTDIEAVAAGLFLTVGLMTDGTVTAAGNNYYGETVVGAWENITAIATGRSFTLGLQSDGTVIGTGEDGDDQITDTAMWTGIDAIAAGAFHSVGLRSDGTVVAVGDNTYGQCDVSGWTDVVAISAEGNVTIGLTSAGTVLATGDNFVNNLDVGAWTDVAEVWAGWDFTLARKTDGTFIVTGDPEYDDVPSMFASSTTIGTIGWGTTAVGLRADLGAGATLDTLDADFEPLASGETVKFAVRLSDDDVSWGDSLGFDGNVVNWNSGTGTYFGQAYGDSSPRADLSALPSARYVQIVVMLEGDEGTSPVLHSVSLDYDDGIGSTFDVSFDSNGGSSVPTQTVATGSFATTPTPDPTLTGYTFAGWYADPALTDPWDFETDPVTGDVTLYAAWSPVAVEVYVVTFVSWDGSVISTQSVESGEDAVAPSAPTREGYTFTGWDTDFTDVTGPLTVTALYTKGAIQFVRHAGVDRYDTASIAAIRDFPDGADIAIVATGENFPDALTASCLAGTVNAPILLTRTASLSPACASALAALRVEKVYIVGSSRAVSTAVESALARTYTIERLGGVDRYATAELIAHEAIGLGASRDEMFLAFGGNFPDALGVSSIAVQRKIPVMLTPTTGLHGSVSSVIRTYGTDDVFIAGGTSVVSPAVATQVTGLSAVVTRWAGDDRYDTAAAVITNAKVRWSLQVTKIGIASGANFPDALAGGAAMGHQAGLLLLSTPLTLSPQIEPIILASKATIVRVEFFGAPNALSQAVQTRVQQLLQ